MIKTFEKAENLFLFQTSSRENMQHKISNKLTIFFLVECSTENADGKESERNKKQPLHLGILLACVNLRQR